jgi:predicted dehydrogenase
MPDNSISRRDFLQKSTVAGATATAFTIVKPHQVRGAGKSRLKAGLIGCGGRGTQSVFDLIAGTENVEFVAMADVFEDKLENSFRSLTNPGEREMRRYVGAVVEKNGNPKHALTAEEIAKEFKTRIKVEPTSRFVGFEAYKKLVASDIDIVMLCTPPGYRPEHFEAAINAKKHVFCEKPFGTDPVGVRRFMDAAKKSEQMKLTVMTGAQRRNQQEYVQTVEKIKNGAIGDVVATYAYWVGSPVIQQRQRNPKWGDMEFQHRNWYSYVWICGDQVVEQHLHNIDVCNWVMGTHPASVVATGGAVWRPREEIYGNIYDHISADFVYPNGARMSSYCRQFPGKLYQNVSELIVGSKGRSNGRDLGTRANDPYMQEHVNMVRSIRGEGPFINDAMAVAESTMTCIMARESAYSGLEITWDMIMNSKQDLQPKAFGYDAKMEVPPLPVPGQYKFV